ncbi:MAG TPA: phage tail length tape measure family protein [Steroidobacteraceae bacterium]|nr:phage tail length tape measure family protein [Steroidobacteraceae bacterium]
MASKKTDYEVKIGGDASGLKRATEEGARALGNLRKNAAKNFEGLRTSIFDVRGALTGLVAGFSIKAVIDNTIQAEKAAKLLNQTLTATGRQSEFSAQQLLDYAGALQNVTAFGDEAITDVERLLLTFKRIGAPVFQETTAATLDMAEALGMDLAAAAKLVGRALDDPIKGAAGLAAANVQLTNAQLATIKRLVETGHAADAQRIILDELEKRFKGAASAAADTFGGALTQLKNAAGDLLEGNGGSLNEAKESIQALTAELQKPETKQAFSVFVGGVITLVGWLAKLVTVSAEAARGLGEFTARMVTGEVAPEDYADEIERLNRALAMEQRLNSMSPGRNRERQKSLEAEIAALKERKRILDGYNTPKAATTTTTAGAGSTQAAPSIEDIKARIEAQQASLQASGVLLADYIKRTQAALDYSYQQNLISFRDYYAQRAALETKALDQQIAEQRVALAKINQEIREKAGQGADTGAEENQRKQAIAQLTVLERQRGDIAVKAALEQAKAEQELSDQLAQVRERLLGLQGQSGEAQTSALEREFRDLLKRLQVEGDAAGEAMVRKLFDVEKAKIALDDLQAQYDRTLAEMGRSESTLQLNIESGLITEREGRREVLALHQQTAEKLKALLPQMRQLAEATGDPEAIDRLKDMDLELQKLSQSASDLGDTLADSISSGIESGFSALADGGGWKGALRAFFTAVGNSIQQQLSKEAADAAGTYVKRIFNAASQSGSSSDGGGNWLSSLGSFFAGLFHSGGVAGQSGGQRRAVPAIAFAGAPRYHSGGVAGLKPDEVPAILQKGERVLTKDQQKGFGAVMAPVSVTIVTQDANSFRRAQGEVQAQLGQAVMNAVKRNR